MSNVPPLQMLVSCFHGKQLRLTNIAGSFFSRHVKGEILPFVDVFIADTFPVLLLTEKMDT